MIRFIGMDAMLHISFSLAAFVFSVVLFALLCFRGSGEERSSRRFITLTVTIVFGNLLSILDNVFRDAGIFPTPYAIQLLLLLGVYVANILLTYYMAYYMEGFFAQFRWKQFFHRFHLILVISALLITVLAFITQLALYRGEEIATGLPIQFRVLLGYVYELYFLVYVSALFIIYRKTLTRRARITSICAFAVVIGGVLFELLNTFGVGSGILYNYFGAVIGLYIFYIGVETPDYRNLVQSMEELREARILADEANRSKSDFLANMSHEIRTPINAILGMNEMILREEENEDIRTYAENIGSAGSTLLGLINDILDFSKIEAGKVDIRPENYDLAVLLSDLVNMVHTRADEKGLLLLTEFDRELPRHLYGDEVRVKQVISNLLTNAVKYTEKGNVSFTVRHEKDPEDPDAVLLHVTVADTGIGIKKEDLSKLFVEFERIEEKRNRNIEGTGLGMTITKRLLALMGSSLQVESIYGKGSTFSFVLKQGVKGWEPLGDYQAAAQDRLRLHERYYASFTAPSARILVVDDNQMNLMVVKSLLKQTKIMVDTATDGDEGLFLTKHQTYDLIFLDHMMPQKDGIETLQELRGLENNQNRNKPAICLTANAIAGAKEFYLREGFADYLPKPINSGELERLLLFYLPQDKIVRTTPADRKPTQTMDTPADQEPPQSMDTPAEKEPPQPMETTAETETVKKYITPVPEAAEPLETDEYQIPEELFILESYGVDVEAGVVNSDDPEVYISLLEAFHESLEEKANELEGYRMEQDWENYTILVHSMKSSLRLLGIGGLGEDAQALEFAGRDRDTAFIDTHHAAFMEAYRGLQEPLTKVFYLLG